MTENNLSAYSEEASEEAQEILERLKDKKLEEEA